MSTSRYHSLADVNSGSFTWNVKVRIIRSWRGVSFSGEQFKGLNILLLDDQNNRMHAFVPGNIIEKHEDKLVEGNICNISNFSVKDYKMEEKFRCINCDRQIILTTYSKVVKIDQDDILIPKNLFDFYDLCDLSDIANDNVYLTDVIGVIQKDLPLTKVMNKMNNIQSQVKFTIVDGSASVNVTFWDSIADEFENAKDEVTEFPIIIIIASAKITSWQGTKQTTAQVEISNVSATKFYLNYQHHHVSHMRKMLTTPVFSKYDFSSQIPEKIEVLSVDQIKKLTMDYIQKEVICEVKVVRVLETNTWYFYECSSCYKEIESQDGNFKCYRCCDRNVPHPYKKWSFHIEAKDSSGKIDILLFDREARTILPIKGVQDAEKNTSNKFPKILKTLENNIYTIKLEIKCWNINKTDTTYHATGISPTLPGDTISNMEQSMGTYNIDGSSSQASGSSYHLDGFSQLNFQSPDTTQRKKRSLVKKKM